MRSAWKMVSRRSGGGVLSEPACLRPVRRSPKRSDVADADDPEFWHRRSDGFGNVAGYEVRVMTLSHPCVCVSKIGGDHRKRRAAAQQHVA